MSKLAASWHRAWAQLHLRPADGLVERLLQAYAEPQRHYHAVQHLEECIAHLDAVRHLAARPAEVDIALWVHDAIYDPQGKDNELRSAEWAVAALKQAHAATDIQQRVHELIMATRHEAEPVEPDQRLLVDIDLAILGASPARFAEYDRQIKAEYSWAPDALYDLKRKEVLAGFLARPCIYGTGHFRDCLEARARANLGQVLA